MKSPKHIVLTTATLTIFSSLLGLLVIGSVGHSRHDVAHAAVTSVPPRVAVAIANVSPPAAHAELVAYGKDLIATTSTLIGPDVADPAMRYSGSNLDCQSCHLDAGTRPFASPYAGVVEEFPKYRGREGKVVPIESRVNGCMMRSMNGKPLPNESREMKAIVAYMTSLSRASDPAQAASVRGFGEFKAPERAVDLEHGAAIYEAQCTSCHQADGQGVLNNPDDPSQGYAFPALWGNSSYNLGAGMARVLTAAAFIKNNMPYGVTYESPVLTDKEAYDVAGFINNQQRPVLVGAENDYPKLYEKPADSPYGPYADSFPSRQHRVGPFGPITAELEALEEQAGGN